MDIIIHDDPKIWQITNISKLHQRNLISNTKSKSRLDVMWLISNSAAQALHTIICCYYFDTCMHFLYSWNRAVQIATGSKLLDTKYEFYGFSDDLKDTIN